MMNDSALIAWIEANLGDGEPSDGKLLETLDALLQRLSCVVGTVHQLEPKTRLLELRAQRGVPETVLELVRTIPIGKGMAGLAAERLEPVQVCDLQTDESGDARPGAKETQMKGSIALPMFDGDRLCGVLGIAKPQEYEFSGQEIDLLMKAGRAIGSRMSAQTG